MSIRKNQLEANKLQKRLRRNVGQAIADYNMIEDGDRVMVCMSGGKDSYGMLDILLNLQASAPISFELVAVNLDQKQPGFPRLCCQNTSMAWVLSTISLRKIPTALSPARFPRENILQSLFPSAPRNLYGFAEQIGCTKVALGHHRDDIVETLFLNMFHQAKLKAMPLLLYDKKNIIIRPWLIVVSQIGGLG